MTDPRRLPRPDWSSNADDTSRGLSEVLSYSLVFSLIVISIAIVTVGGLSSLQDARTSEQLQNAERAYDVLHDNLAAVHTEGAPSRATEISLEHWELYFGDHVTLRVEVDGTWMDFETIRPIVYRVDEQHSLVYEAGAIVQDSRAGGRVVNEPPFVFTAEGGPEGGQVHVPVVNTTAPTVRSLGGSTIIVRGQSSAREVSYSRVNGSGTIDSLRIETPRYEIWEDYFDSRAYCEDVDPDESNGWVTCDVHDDYDNPGQLYVTHQEIDVELDQ